MTIAPYRILHLVQDLHYGGMERLLNELVHALRAEGCEMHVGVVGGFGRFGDGLERSATLHRVPPMSRLSLLRPQGLISLTREVRPDLLHSHEGVWLKASLAARATGVPLVQTEHGRPDPDRLVDRWSDNLASRSTAIVIAVSEPLGEVLRRKVVHDPGRVRVIANGIDTRRLAPQSGGLSVRLELGIPPDALVVGSVGRLEPVKNYQLALHAFAAMRSHRNGGSPRFLLLVGDGQERRSLESAAQSLGIAQEVRFLGWRDDVERLYAAFDVFALTSRSEGTSVSLLEAMGSGVCPVVTDVGGNRRVLGPGLENLLVPSGDAAAVASAWQRCLEDPGYRSEVGHRVRDRVEREFSLTRMVARHLELYHEVIQAWPRRAR